MSTKRRWESGSEDPEVDEASTQAKRPYFINGDTILRFAGKAFGAVKQALAIFSPVRWVQQPKRLINPNYEGINTAAHTSLENFDNALENSSADRMHAALKAALSKEEPKRVTSVKTAALPTAKTASVGHRTELPPVASASSTTSTTRLGSRHGTQHHSSSQLGPPLLGRRSRKHIPTAVAGGQSVRLQERQHYKDLLAKYSGSSQQQPLNHALPNHYSASALYSPAAVQITPDTSREQVSSFKEARPPDVFKHPYPPGPSLVRQGADEDEVIITSVKEAPTGSRQSMLGGHGGHFLYSTPGMPVSGGMPFLPSSLSALPSTVRDYDSPSRGWLPGRLPVFIRPEPFPISATERPGGLLSDNNAEVTVAGDEPRFMGLGRGTPVSSPPQVDKTSLSDSRRRSFSSPSDVSRTHPSSTWLDSICADRDRLNKDFQRKQQLLQQRCDELLVERQEMRAAEQANVADRLQQVTERVRTFRIIPEPLFTTQTEEEEVVSPPCLTEEQVVSLPCLIEEQERMVDRAWTGDRGDEMLSEGFNIQIRRNDLQTLAGQEWLNDEVINFYFLLLKQRSESNKNLPKMHVMSSFFYPKLAGPTGYAGVKRWTRKVDIFSKDLLAVPIHLGMHWCLAMIDFRKKEISYFDSLLGGNPSCLERLKDYLEQESLDKRKTSFDTSDWKLLTPKDIPEQMNGSDCGVFSCIYAHYLSQDKPLNFSQTNMPYFRRRMTYEILSKSLLE